MLVLTFAAFSFLVPHFASNSHHQAREVVMMSGVPLSYAEYMASRRSEAVPDQKIARLRAEGEAVIRARVGALD